jgi:D-glycero-D-manno-heptose 1,7-bisphosphate phosphatase
MARPAIFFDRDNTLIVGNDYLGDPAHVTLVRGAADAVATARALGYATVVVSNQSGVARGMFGEEDVRAVNQRMDQMLQAENPEAIIDRHEFCPFHPQAPVEKYRLDSDRRKPRPGMLLAAAREMDLDLAQSWIIGDAARDIEAGKAAGCRAILFTDPTLAASPAAQSNPRVPPDFSASSLSQAIDHIAAATASPASALSSPAQTPDPRARTEYPPANKAPTIQDTSLETDTPAAMSTARLEMLADQILQEMRRGHDHHPADFSVTKLLAGITQVIAIAVMFLAYLNKDSTSLDAVLLLGIFLESLTCALLIMSRQK